jgi:hypothetical protein
MSGCATASLDHVASIDWRPGTDNHRDVTHEEARRYSVGGITQKRTHSRCTCAVLARDGKQLGGQIGEDDPEQSPGRIEVVPHR